MRYYLSTIADVGYDCSGTEEITYTKRTAETAAKYGLGLELAEFCISENLDEKFSRVLPHFEYNRQASEDPVLHAPYNELFPHAIDSRVVLVARQRYDWTWDLCRKYGIRKIIVHPNYVHCLYYPQWFTARHIEFWKDFLSSHTEDITICLENVMEPYPDLITDIIRDVGDDRLKMCIDVGHANLTGISPLDWLKECSPFIDHYHIHNNEGPAAGDRSSLGDRHAPPGRGVINMKALLDTAEKLTPNATAAVESSETEESAEWLKENGFI